MNKPSFHTLLIKRKNTYNKMTMTRHRKSATLIITTLSFSELTVLFFFR